MKASKITHKQENRIRVDFPYQQEVVKSIKQISGSRWSNSLKTWHIPYTKLAFEQLTTMFPDLQFDKSDQQQNQSEIVSPSHEIKQEVEFPNKPREKMNDTSNVKLEIEKITAVKTLCRDAVRLEFTPKTIYIKMPKNETDIAFIRTFNFVRWDISQYRWSIPNYGKIADVITAYFGKRVVEIIEHQPDEATLANRLKANSQPKFNKTDFLVINNSNRTLYLVSERKLVSC